MPPLPSDAEPRSPEDFAPLLATKEPVLLVGGQAVNLWAMYYETRTDTVAFDHAASIALLSLMSAG